MGLTQTGTDGIKDDAITLAKQAAGTDGQIITYDASGNPVAVGPGTDGQVLTSTGAGSPPAFETPAAGVGGATGVDFNDSVKARWGTGDDLQIYHGGSDSIINNDTGDLYVQSDDQLIFKSVGTTEIRKHAGDELMIKAVPDGAVELYHNNLKRIETTAAGVKVSRDTQCDFVIEGDVDGFGGGLELHNASNTNNAQMRIRSIDAAGDDTSEIRFLHDVPTSNSGSIQFWTRPAGGSLTERIRIPNTGGIAFNGDTAAANALNDYEEGTWTPNPLFESNEAGETALTGSGGLFGRYTKIGNLVYCHFSVNFTGRSGTASGVFYIGGLPFAISAANWNEDGGTVHYYTGITTPASPPTIMCVSTNKIKMAQAGTAIRDNAVTDWNDQWSANEVGTGDIRIRGSFTYHTAA